MYHKTLKQCFCVLLLLLICNASGTAYAACCTCGDAFPVFTGSGSDCGYASMCRSILEVTNPSKCTGTFPNIECSVCDGEVLSLYGCNMTVNCSGPPKIPKNYGRAKLEENGYKKGTTPETGDPVPAAGGEFRHSWNLLSLDGLMPFNFNLIYASDLSTQTPASDGLLQFSPPNIINVFNTSAVIRLVEFTDKSLVPNTDYINILMAEELLVFKYDSASGKFVHQGPEKYQIEKNAATGNYYLMNPASELIYIFRSRALSYEMVSQSLKLNRVGEVAYIQDRNGNRLTFTYNNDYLPIKVDDNAGRYLDFTYNSDGYLSYVSNHCGNSVSFVYQELTCGGVPVLTLTGFTDHLGKTTTFVYDATSTGLCFLIQKINNPLGNSHINQQWTTNTKGIPAIDWQKDAYGDTMVLNYAQNQTTVTYPDGMQRVFMHESNRYPTGGTDPVGKSFGFDHTADKLMSKITDRMGGITQMTSPFKVKK